MLEFNNYLFQTLKFRACEAALRNAFCTHNANCKHTSTKSTNNIWTCTSKHKHLWRNWTLITSDFSTRDLQNPPKLANNYNFKKTCENKRFPPHSPTRFSLCKMLLLITLICFGKDFKIWLLLGLQLVVGIDYPRNISWNKNFIFCFQINFFVTPTETSTKPHNCIFFKLNKKLKCKNDGNLVSILESIVLQPLPYNTHNCKIKII